MATAHQHRQPAHQLHQHEHSIQHHILQQQYSGADLTAHNQLQTPAPHLRHISESHPQLLNASSKQSIAASEDFYSLSESEREDEDVATPTQQQPRTYPEFSHLQEHPDPNLHTPVRNITPVNDSHLSQETDEFITPPSRANSTTQENAQIAAAIHEAEQSSPKSPALEKQLRRKPVSATAVVNEHDIIARQSAIIAAQTVPDPLSRRVTVLHNPKVEAPSLQPVTMDGRSIAGRTATPGTDDMPYIRFAIDQLTRDEEVRGSRVYTSQPPVVAPPVPTAPVKLPSSARHAQPVPQQPVPKEHRTSNIIATDTQPVSTRSRSIIKPQPAHVVPTARHSSSSEASPTPIAHYEVFMPYDSQQSAGNLQHLTALPLILKPVGLRLFFLACLLMLVGLIFCGAWSQRHNGLWLYRTFGDNRYFTFHYLPAIFGMSLVLWLLQLQIAIQRIAPFMAMASASNDGRSQAALLDLYPTHFLYPRTQYFRSGQWIFSVFHICSWVFLLTVPLLSASFNVRWTVEGDLGSWRWTTVHGALWTVVALYIVLLLNLIILMVYLRRHQSGLLWDPQSLADIVTLLERANIMSDYADSEIFATKGQFCQRLWKRADRLGYWRTSRRPNDIFYGIGAEGAAARRYSLEQGRLREKISYSHSRDSSVSTLRFDGDPEDSAMRSDLRDTYVLTRHVPWMLTTMALLVFSLIAVAFFIAFLTVSFVDRATLAGFFPSVRANADMDGFSPANFLYAFVAGLLGLMCLLLWQPLDFAIRRMAPFSGLCAPDGATASRSLLLNYPSLFSPWCVVRALMNRDWLVAFSALVSTLSAVIPVIAGGVFWAQYYPESGQVRVAAERAGWYALWFFLAVNALTYPALLIVSVVRRGLVPALPHRALCLAELVSWLYMSPITTDTLFAHVSTRADLIAHLHAGSSSLTRRNGAHAPQATEHSPRQAGENSPPRLTVRLLGDESSSRSSDVTAPHNQLPGQVGLSPRNSASNHSLNITRPLSPLVRAAGPVRFAFGIYIGRDGREHLGIDRFVRDGREMVVMSGTQTSRAKRWLRR